MVDSRTADKFVLRMPDGMRDKYREQAQLNGRSMNSEMIRVLEAGLGEPQAPVNDQLAELLEEMADFRRMQRQLEEDTAKMNTQIYGMRQDVQAMLQELRGRMT